jgi:hypothetical protein
MDGSLETNDKYALYLIWNYNGSHSYCCKATNVTSKFVECVWVLGMRIAKINSKLRILFKCFV